MFSRPGRKAWQPKNLPQGTTREVTIKSATVKSATDNPTSRPSTPSRTPSRPKPPSSAATSTTTRKRGTTDSPVASVSLSRRPSPPRKKSKSVPINCLNDDDDTSGEEPDVVFARKSQPKAATTTVRQDMARKMVSRALKALDAACYVDAPELDFVHACDVLSISRPDNGHEPKPGKKVAKQAAKVFPLASDEDSKIELQYPASLTRERFHLVQKDETLDVIKDIYKVVKNVRNFYITGDDEAQGQLDGILKRLKRHSGMVANNNQKVLDIVGYRRAIDDYNEIVLRRLISGETLKVLQKKTVLPDDLVEHIMVQLYNRIITPQVDKVKQYENGTDFIYGEMHSKFTTQVLCKDTNMEAKQTFVDLGSGVGNVVLQAALQIGCSSWGCEIMDAPATLAEAQYEEFVARCKLWGIQPGEVHLIHGDFKDHHPELWKALMKADVVVTNNARFTPELNQRLVMKFLDLKPGCKVVSLTDLSAASRYNVNDIAFNSLTEADAYTWKDGWVSWKGVSETEAKAKNSYYITTRRGKQVGE